MGPLRTLNPLLWQILYARPFPIPCARQVGQQITYEAYQLYLLASYTPLLQETKEHDIGPPAQSQEPGVPLSFSMRLKGLHKDSQNRDSVSFNHINRIYATMSSCMVKVKSINSHHNSKLFFPRNLLGGNMFSSPHKCNCRQRELHFGHSS